MTTNKVYTLTYALDRIISPDYMGLADSITFVSPVMDNRLTIVVQIPTHEDGTFDNWVAAEAQTLRHELQHHSHAYTKEELDTSIFLKTVYKFELADGGVFLKIKIRR